MHCITVKKIKLMKYRISWLPRLKTDGDYFVITYYRAFIYIVRLVMFSWCEKCNISTKNSRIKEISLVSLVACVDTEVRMCLTFYFAQERCSRVNNLSVKDLQTVFCFRGDTFYSMVNLLIQKTYVLC